MLDGAAICQIYDLPTEDKRLTRGTWEVESYPSCLRRLRLSLVVKAGLDLSRDEPSFRFSQAIFEVCNFFFYDYPASHHL